MNLRMKITDVLSGGAITALIGERDRAKEVIKFSQAEQKIFTANYKEANAKIIESARKTIEPLHAENVAMKRTLEQIGKELTDLIDMPQHRRTTTALRAIRALTKGPHK